MQHDLRSIEARVDGYTRLCLTAIAVLLTILVIGLWADGVRSTDKAVAADRWLDSSAQRNSLVQIQKETNRKLDELIALLKSGEIKVQLTEAPAKGAGARHVKSAKTK